MRGRDPYLGREILGGQFRIIERIGSGGMGAVYKADQPAMGRFVAIKILHSKFSNRADLVSRFRREARAMSHLSHPNTARVFLYGTLEDGAGYIVMEFLEGQNLGQVVRSQGPMDPERAIHVLVQVCGALDEAHKAGIVHRDLKPENIFLTTQGNIPDFPKVLDFGLAKVTEREMRPGSVMLTQEGMVFGTPEFMSPEQAQGKKLDGRSDIYSLASILFELLTGKLPFQAKQPMEYLSLHIHQKPLTLAERAPTRPFPSGLQGVMDRALAKKPDDRFTTAGEFSAALKACLAPQLVVQGSPRPQLADSGAQIAMQRAVADAPAHAPQATPAQQPQPQPLPQAQPQPQALPQALPQAQPQPPQPAYGGYVQQGYAQQQQPPQGPHYQQNQQPQAPQYQQNQQPGAYPAGPMQPPPQGGYGYSPPAQMQPQAPMQPQGGYAQPGYAQPGYAQQQGYVQQPHGYAQEPQVTPQYAPQQLQGQPQQAGPAHMGQAGGHGLGYAQPMPHGAGVSPATGPQVLSSGPPPRPPTNRAPLIFLLVVIGLTAVGVLVYLAFQVVPMLRGHRQPGAAGPELALVGEDASRPSPVLAAVADAATAILSTPVARADASIPPPAIDAATAPAIPMDAAALPEDASTHGGDAAAADASRRHRTILVRVPAPPPGAVPRCPGSVDGIVSVALRTCAPEINVIRSFHCEYVVELDGRFRRIAFPGSTPENASFHQCVVRHLAALHAPATGTGCRGRVAFP